MRIARSLLLLVILAGSALALAPQAQAAPTPVASCAFPAMTNVKLTADLSCPGTSGIVVGKSGITIDLGGHTLTGDRAGGTDGINDSGGFDNVTVKGGTVEKFEEGVYGFGGANAMHVQGVVASGNSDSGMRIIGDSTVVTSSQFSGNGDDGIFIQGNSAHVTSSPASGNAFDGIIITGDSGRVKSSPASGNAHNGISIIGGAARVTSSPASGNALHGISITGASGSVASSQASGNGGDGILINGNSARVTSSRVWGNDANGIEISGDTSTIGQAPGRASSDRNRADANGFPNGAANNSGLGIFAHTFATPPVGRNEASGNDAAAQCDPTNLC